MNVPPRPVDRYTHLLRMLSLGRFCFFHRSEYKVELAHFEFVSLREAALASLCFVFDSFEFLPVSFNIEYYL